MQQGRAPLPGAVHPYAKVDLAEWPADEMRTGLVHFQMDRYSAGAKD